MFAKVDARKCIGCGICEEACPNGSISIGDVAVVSEEICIGCSSCADECPAEAISIVNEDD